MNSILILTATAMAVLFAGAYNVRKALLPIAATGVALALLALLGEWKIDEGFIQHNVLLQFLNAIHLDTPNAPIIEKYMQGMMHFDNYAIAFSTVMFIGTLLILFLSDDYFRQKDGNTADVYALLIFTLAGGLMMTAFTNMAMLFIGIETLSISLYILAGSRRNDLYSNESAIKYFLMGSFSTGFLLFGIALMYGTTGTFEIGGLRDYIQSIYVSGAGFPMLFKTGVVLLLIGLLFKISAAPFHFWAPDVYQGAPTIITAFMASVVKTAGLAAILKMLTVVFGGLTEWRSILWVVAATTVIIGNFTAVYQRSVKRMLAYSSIANVGYLLISMTAIGENTIGNIFYYTLAYSLATITAFAVLMAVQRDRGSEDYEAFTGLAWRNPLLGGLMVIAMLSLAGIPPLAGFFAKYAIFWSALDPDATTSTIRMPMLVTLGVLTSLIGVYYYFRVIVAIFTPDEDAPKLYVKNTFRAVLITAAILLLFLGLYPNQVINPINQNKPGSVPIEASAEQP